MILVYILGIKEDGNDLFKKFFIYLKKNIIDICWILKKWGGKKEFRKLLLMILFFLDFILYYNLYV